MWRSLRISLAILLAALVVNCVGQDEPIVNLPDLGYIKGRITQTLGNLGHEKKPYYNFRNIPFAESVSGEYRFSVRKILYIPYFQNELPHNSTILNETKWKNKWRNYLQLLNKLQLFPHIHELYSYNCLGGGTFIMKIRYIFLLIVYWLYNNVISF